MCFYTLTPRASNIAITHLLLTTFVQVHGHGPTCKPAARQACMSMMSLRMYVVCAAKHY